MDAWGMLRCQYSELQWRFWRAAWLLRPIFCTCGSNRNAQGPLTRQSGYRRADRGVRGTPVCRSVFRNRTDEEITAHDCLG